MNRDELMPEPLLEMAYGAWAAKTLAVATELGVFTSIAEKGVLTIEELADRLGTATRPAEMLLNTCVSLGLLEKNGAIYGNSRLADEFLVKGKPSYYGDQIILTGVNDYEVWLDIKEAILTNAPVRPNITALTGQETTADPFTRAMHGVAVAPANALADLFDLSAYGCLLDLGGGSGAYSIAMVQRYPRLKAIVFDLAQVCTVAEEFIQQMQVDSNVTTHPGDFLMDSYPPGADVALLGNVLHHRGEDTNRMFINKVYDYLPAGGMVIIVDLLLNDDKAGPLFATLFGMHMLAVSDDGKTYTEAEVRSMLTAAGFTDVGSHLCFSGRHSAVYGTKQAQAG